MNITTCFDLSRSPGFLGCFAREQAVFPKCEEEPPVDITEELSPKVRMIPFFMLKTHVPFSIIEELSPKVRKNPEYGHLLARNLADTPLVGHLPSPAVM
jgi:hypothetical protein